MPGQQQKVKLGRDQVLSLDGVVLEGVREVDVDVDSRTVDVTPWSSQYASTLPLVLDGTIRLLIYWKEDWDKVNAKLHKFPPQPIQLAVSNFFTIRCLPVSAKVMQPIAGVLAWEVTLKAYSYQ